MSSSASRAAADWMSPSARVLVDGDFASSNESFSCYHPLVVEYRYLAVLWGCLLSITGTAGNLMTILAFALDPRLRTRFNVLIVNLALADLLSCTALRPTSVDSYLHLRWRGGRMWCRAFGLLFFLSNSVSIITLCLIAVGRYLLVGRRAVFERVFSNGGLCLLLASSWALGLASFAPLWPVYVFVPQVCTCSFHRTQGQPYTSVLLFFYFFVGLLCIGVFYLLIYRRVRAAGRAQSRRRPGRRSSGNRLPPSAPGPEDVSSMGMNTGSSELRGLPEPLSRRAGATWENTAGEPQPTHAILGHASSEAQGTTPPATTPPTPPARTPAAAPAPPHVRQGSGKDVEFRKVTWMCFSVFMCFVFCFAPFLLLNISDRENSAPQVLHMFCANLTWLNSCINPVLYAVMNKQFLQSYHQLLSRAVTPLAFLWRHRSTP